jgi:hypothetical protein
MAPSGILIKWRRVADNRHLVGPVELCPDDCIRSEDAPDGFTIVPRERKLGNLLGRLREFSAFDRQTTHFLWQFLTSGRHYFDAERRQARTN